VVVLITFGKYELTLKSREQARKLWIEGLRLYLKAYKYESAICKIFG